MRYILILGLLALLVGQAFAAKVGSIDASDSLGATPIPVTASLRAATSSISAATVQPDVIRSNAAAARVLWRVNY